MQLTARKRRVASPWGRQAPGSACDRLLPPPGRVAEPQRRAALTLPQPRERRGERFYEHARHPAHVRRPANHLYGLVRGEGSAVVRYGEPLRGAAPGSEPNSGTTPPSPRSRRYGSPMRVDHSVSHDAPGLRRTERVHQARTPNPASGEGFHRTLTDKRSRRTNDPGQSAVRFPSSSQFFLEGAPPGLAQHFPAERAQSSTFRLAGSAATVRV